MVPLPLSAPSTPINIGSSNFQCLFNPGLHKTLDGEYVSIVGNTSDDNGDCSLCEIKLAFFKAFIVANECANFNKALSLRENIMPTLLANTSWTDSPQPIAACTLPNCFPVYYRQEPIYGDIRLEDVRTRMAALGKRYKIWVAYAHSAFLLVDDILTLIENNVVDFNNPNKENIRRYLDLNYVNGESLCLANLKGLCGTLNVV